MLNDDVKQEATKLISWQGDQSKKVDSSIGLSQNGLRQQITSNSDDELAKVREYQTAIEVRRVQIIGTGEFNAETGRWEAQNNQYGSISLASTDFEKTFKQLHTEIERDAKKDWQKYMEEAYISEYERRRQTYTEEEAASKLTPEIFYLNDQGGTEKDFIASYSRLEDDGQFSVKYTPLGYDRLPPDIKAEMEEEFGGRENIVGKWIPDSEEMMEKHDAFIRYSVNDDGYDTWEAYQGAKRYGNNEKVMIESAQDVDKISTPNQTPSVATEKSPDLTK